MLSDSIVELCKPGGQTVTAHAAQHPNSPIHELSEHLFKGSGKLHEVTARLNISSDHAAGTAEGNGAYPEQEELEAAARCGAFPNRPSDLYLAMYSAVIRTLDRHPLAGMVSPSLMGSSGVVPLSIISIIPDIMKVCFHGKLGCTHI